MHKIIRRPAFTYFHKQVVYWERGGCSDDGRQFGRQNDSTTPTAV